MITQNICNIASQLVRYHIFLICLLKESLFTCDIQAQFTNQTKPNHTVQKEKQKKLLLLEFMNCPDTTMTSVSFQNKISAPTHRCESECAKLTPICLNQWFFFSPFSILSGSKFDPGRPHVEHNCRHT